MAEEPTKLDISDEMIAERRGGSNKMPNDMPRWMANSIISIDKFSKIVGNVVCWILMPLIFMSSFNMKFLLSKKASFIGKTTSGL